MQTKDFFVSYNKSDKEWAKWVAGTLEENGYSVFLQAWDISPGDDFIEQMNKFLKSAKNYIAILSNAFMQSPYCQKEFQTAFNEHLNDKLTLFLPLRVEDVLVDPLYNTTVYIDLFGLNENMAKKKLLDGIRHTENPRKKGTFPPVQYQSVGDSNSEINPNQNSKHTTIDAEYSPGLNCSVIRDIIILENNNRKKGDLFNQLIYDVFHSLGFCQPRFNVQKIAHEIDIVLQHRTEKRVALVECKAHNSKMGGAEINKFVGMLDVEKRKYERDGNSVTGYFVSQTGFTETAIEQEKQRAEYSPGHVSDNEIILLGPSEITRELVQGNVLCSIEQATSAVRFSQRYQLSLCKWADLLVCEQGWIWVLYYSKYPEQQATHFSMVHADGNPLVSTVANNVISKAKQIKTQFGDLIYIDVFDDDPEKKQLARTAYFKYLENELGEIQFEGMPADKEAGAVKVNLENIFVPLRFSDVKSNREDRKKKHTVSIDNILNSSNRSAILAKPGGGKSTLIRRIALAYAYPNRKEKVNDNLPDYDWFPVYIRCRDLGSDATKSIQEIIASIVYRAEISQYLNEFKSLVEDALQAGRVLLLIDGLDEITVEQHRISFVNQLRTFIATYPTVHLLVTSRESGYRAVAGVMVSYCDQYLIADLNNEQIEQLSLKWHEAILSNIEQAKEDSRKVCSIITSDQRILTLAKNPLLLTTLLFVKRWVGYLPTKRCQLYEEMIKLLLVTWNSAAHLRLDLDETEPQLAYIAYQMTKRGEAKITRDKLEQDIISARKSLPDILGYTNVTPAKFIDQVEERSSLLIQQGLEENDRGILVPSYEFSHLSFQEYLAAKAVVESWTPEADGLNEGLLSLLKYHYNETKWIEVIPLAAVLSGRQVRDSIEFLLQCNTDQNDMTSDPKSRILKPMADFSAVHLANIIASEVPMSMMHLDRAIKIVVSNKRDIELTYRHNSRSLVDVFSIILNSKYGDKYQKTIDDVLFGQYDDIHVANYLAAWYSIFKERGKKPTLHDMLQFLNSEERKDNIRGLYMLMEHAFNLSWRSASSLTKQQNKIIYERIFARVTDLLASKDELVIFCASWCIAWSGYNSCNILPEKYCQTVLNQLVELWTLNKGTINMRRNISWAISSTCRPQLRIVRTNELQEQIINFVDAPQNDHDEIAGIYLAVLCSIWTREEVQIRLDGIKEQFALDNKRFLKDLGFRFKNRVHSSRVNVFD